MKLSTSRSLSWVPILLALFGLASGASAQSSNLGRAEQVSSLYARSAPSPVVLRGGDVVLYDQVQGTSTSGNASQNNAVATQNNNRVADDFSVPAGQTWNVSQVFARGFYLPGTVTAACTTADVTFYANGPGEPGAVLSTANVAPTTDTAGALTLNFPAVTLAAGATLESRFWVSVVCNGPTLNNPAGAGQARWLWFGNTVTRGNIGQQIFPGNPPGIPPGWFDLTLDRDFRLSGTSTGTALFPEVAFSPNPLLASVMSGGTATATLTIQNLGDADLLFSFPAFAALKRIRELTLQGVDLNRRDVVIDNLMPKGIEGYGSPGGTGLQYRVGGPDAFGYTFIDSGETGGPVLEAINIAATGTTLTLAGDLDDGEEVITLPFAFNFYGTNYTNATVGANGAIILQNNTTLQQITFANSATMPNAAVPNTVIAPFWDDFDGGTTGSVLTETLGDGRFVIQWNNMPRFGAPEAAAPNTFQIILSPDGTIKFQYPDINAVANNSSTIGIENATGTQGLLVNANTAGYVVDGLAIQFNAPTLFLAGVTPTSGTVAPGASAQVQVAVSGMNQSGFPIQPGTYTQNLSVSTNDQDEAAVSIPVNLTVTGSAPSDPLVVTPNPVSTTLASGTTGSATVTITNNTATAVPFSFPQYGATARGALPQQQPAMPEAAKGDDSFSGASRFLDEGGPDAFGYQWSDSNEPGGPTYAFTDISTTGTPVTLGDDASVSVPLPFTFPFYGVDQTAVRIVSNGFLAFGGTSNAFSNAAIPTAAIPNNVIAPYWDDLNPTNGGTIVHQTMGDGTFIVQYTNVPRFTASSGTVSFQVILSPSGAIKYQYQAIPTVNDSKTIGLENADGTDGLQIAFNTVTRPTYGAAGLAVLIQARPAFVTSVTPPSGTIPANGSVQVQVGFDATGLIAGQYTGEIDLVTPDSTVALGVVLNVTGMPTVTVAPNPVAFGDVIVGASDSTAVTITNNGTSDLTVTAVTSSNAAFTVDVTTPFTIAPGATDSLEVTFTPTAVGAATGTLSIVSNATTSPNTVALSGNGLAPPAFSVNPASLTFTVDRGTVSAPQALTLSNTGAGAGAFTSDVVFTPSRPLPVNNGPLQALAKGETAVTDLAAALGFQPSASTSPATYANRGGVDCNAEPGIIIHDDGTAENGYSGNAAVVSQVTLVDRFTPTSYPATFTSVCVAFIAQAGGPSTIPFEVVAYDDDGAAGAPGTILGSLSATATNIPGISGAITLVYQTVDISGLDLNIESGNVFIGVRFAPVPAPNVFVASDESTGQPVGVGGGYFGTVPVAGGPVTFAQLGTAATFPAYRAQFIRAVEGPAGPATVTLSPEAGTVAAGGSQAIAVTVDATNSEVGTYQAQIVIATNDPANPVLTVPVTIIVQEVVAGEGQADLPAEVTLYQNYPNPVSQATRIKFALPAAAAVDVRVYDVAGRMVATLMQGEQTAGFHEVSWDASALASGVYFVRMQAGSEMRTMRLSVIR